jgi:hypothetical protein
MSKAPYIFGGILLAGAAYLVWKKPSATATAAPQLAGQGAAKAPTPVVKSPGEWTPPVGFPTLPAGWTLPAGVVPPAGWIPPINWQPPSWIQSLGWTPGQPLPGLPGLPPAVPAGTPTVRAVAPGPRGAAQPVQRAYKLGIDDGQPAGWAIPGIPSTLQNLPPIPGLPGAVASSGAREMSDDDKFALWKTLFANKIQWIDYCFDAASGCMNAHGVSGAVYSKGDKGVTVAQDIAYLNDASPPRDDSYENPGWYVLYSPKTGVFWMAPEQTALNGAKLDDWSIFLRPNEYHALQAKGGPDFTVADDLNPPTVVPSTAPTVASPGIPTLPGASDLPGLPALPGTTALPGTSALPDMSTLPGVGAMQGWDIPTG